MSDARLVVEESCPLCQGVGRTGLGGKCAVCRGSGRRHRDAYAPESGTEAPTAEEREIDALRGEVLGLRVMLANARGTLTTIAMEAEATRWNPRGELLEWAASVDGHNHAHVMNVLSLARSRLAVLR